MALGSGKERTVRDPGTEVALFRSVDEPRLQMVAELANNFVHERLDGEDSTRGVMFGNRALHLLMRSRIRQTKQIVIDLAIDKSAVIMVKGGLFSSLVSVLCVQSRGHTE